MKRFFRKLLGFFLRLFLLFILFLGLFFGYIYYLFYDASSNTPLAEKTENLSKYYTASTNKKAVEYSSLPKKFNFKTFQNPSLQYRPWIKWYWYGNAVNKNGIAKQIQLFKNNYFGGVAILPTSAGLSPYISQEEREKVFTVSSKSFYENLSFALKEAEKNKIFIDLPASPAFPIGGKHVGKNDALQNIFFEDFSVEGKKNIKQALPKVSTPMTYWLMQGLEILWGFEESWYALLGSSKQITDFSNENAKLIEVVAIKELSDTRRWNPLILNDKITLDSSTTKVLTDKVNKKGELEWNVPEGKWRIIVAYAIPNLNNPLFSAESSVGFQLDFLDSTKVIGHHYYFLGSRTALSTSFNKYTRGVFHEAFQLNSENLFTASVLKTFQKRRGYSLSAYIPSLSFAGRNNFLMNQMPWQRESIYQLGVDYQRLSYDYDLTISDIWIDNFLLGSKNWAKDQSLQSRIQPFGFTVDVIKASGVVNIPEMSQGYAGGSRMFLKLISSGANLYNKALVSAEALNFKERSYMTTPQKMKIAADKLFISGANHLVLSAFPYAIFSEEYPILGWFPFFKQHSWFPNTQASHLSEKSIFWEFQKAINLYISRCQYLLRQGKSDADLLIYYPFLGFPEAFAEQNQHQEAFFNGVMPEAEPPFQNIRLGQLKNYVKIDSTSQKIEWLKKTWQLIQNLEKMGYTWDWVNAESLSEAKLDSTKKINIRGNQYKAVILANLPHIDVNAAGNLSVMSKEGLPVILYGEAPEKHAGFANYLENDQKVKEAIKIIQPYSGKSIGTFKRLKSRLNNTPSLESEISYSKDEPYLQNIRRKTSTGQQIIFLHNAGADVLDFKLKVREKYPKYFWLDALSGDIFQAVPDSNGFFRYELEDYSSVFLLCGEPKNFFAKDSTFQQWTPFPKQLKIITLKNWTLSLQGKTINNGVLNLGKFTLQDWRKHPKLKDKSGTGVYVSELNLDSIPKNQKLWLDLGKVYFTAEVSINSKKIKKLWFFPYRLEVTPYLKEGKNRITIAVKTPLYNFFQSTQAQNAQLFTPEGREKRIAGGLLGPVRLLITD